MFSLQQQQNQERGRRTGKCDPCTVRQRTIKGTIGTAFEGVQMVDLGNKDFQAAVVNIFKELKETRIQ